MLPLLQRTAHVGKPTGMIELLPTLAADLHLSDDDLSERLPSGRQGVFHNRMHWAKHYMTRAGLLESEHRSRVSCGKRTVFKIAPDGTETILHSFAGGSDGDTPAAGLIADAQGNLYGTTIGGGGDGCAGLGCGTVFKDQLQ